MRYVSGLECVAYWQTPHPASAETNSVEVTSHGFGGSCSVSRNRLAKNIATMLSLIYVVRFTVKFKHAVARAVGPLTRWVGARVGGNSIPEGIGVRRFAVERCTLGYNLLRGGPFRCLGGEW